MSKKHKARRNHVEEADAIDQFAGFAVEMLRDSHHSDLESFEVYAARIKGQMVRQLEDYRSRLTHGYRVLLDELARESEGPGSRQ